LNPAEPQRVNACGFLLRWLRVAFFGVSQAATVARYRSAASSGKSSEILQQVTNPHRSQAGFFLRAPNAGITRLIQKIEND
jgi:hypothetical protein